MRGELASHLDDGEAFVTFLQQEGWAGLGFRVFYFTSGLGGEGFVGKERGKMSIIHMNF